MYTLTLISICWVLYKRQPLDCRVASIQTAAKSFDLLSQLRLLQAQLSQLQVLAVDQRVQAAPELRLDRLKTHTLILMTPAGDPKQGL